MWLNASPQGPINTVVYMYMDLYNSNCRLIQIVLMDFDIRFKWTTLFM